MAEARERSVMDAELPQPVYGCAHEGCAEEVSYPPDMLRWYEGGEVEAGFYCESCIDNMLVGWDRRYRPSLQAEIERRANGTN